MPSAPDPFQYRAGSLCAEGVRLSGLAERFGTPLYVYSRAALETAWKAFHDALGGTPHQVCFAVKANSNLAVLDVLARLGSGFDVVSGGELERVLAAGGDPERVVFSGVGKSREEMRAGLEAGIRSFNVESASELERLAEVAASVGRVAPAAVRVNPDVDPKTHPHIATGLRSSKFGVPIAEARALYARGARMPSLRMRGVGCHIGSQITSLDPFRDAVGRVAALADALAADGHAVVDLDVGGGLGIRYRDENPPSPAEYVAAVRDAAGDRPLTLFVEPGRSICGNAGVLLTRVEYLKRNGGARFAIVDAAMNDFIRPALYDGWSAIVACERSGAVDGPPGGPAGAEERGEGFVEDGAAPGSLSPASGRSPARAPGSAAGRREGADQAAGPGAAVYTVAGPVCESGDFLGRERRLDLAEGDLVAVCSAGAYGFVMSSNYNARPRAAEVMVDGERAHPVRRRERASDLYAGESRLPA